MQCETSVAREQSGPVDDARNTELRQEIVAAYEDYLTAFLSDDVEGIDRLVSYPLTYIGDGQVTMFDSWPLKPFDLMGQKGWNTTVGVEYEVIGVNETKAHLILRSGTRVRKDGSPIEDVFAFYAWKKTPAGWRMFAVSDVLLPA
jgi:hypothetical protein